MSLYEKNAVSQKSAKAPANGRLEVLAAIWARQTGRSIVVAPGGPYSGRSSSRA